MGDIYGLLRYLGLSAESTRFFHVSYAVYLTTRQWKCQEMCSRETPKI